MKHFYFLIISLICAANAGISQTNSYFNNNPCWQVQSMCEIAQTCYTVNVYNYFINGDSMIGGYQYKQVYKKGYSYSQYGAMGPPPSGNPCLFPPPTYYYSASLAFFIRSVGEKIYVRNAPGYSGDTLLYNFNLQVGDTLPATYNNNTSFSVIKVIAIDSINTFNGWMKRFQLTGNTVSPYLVEGMGHYQGLIEKLNPNVMSCGWGLQCYSQNNTAYYPSSGPSCLMPTGIKENQEQEKLFIYPNPSAGVFNLNLNELSENSKIELYNLTGQLIRSFVPQKETVEIDIRKEPDGIYFLNYISNGVTKSVKLIKK